MDLIDWNSVTTTDPLLTESISDNDLNMMNLNFTEEIHILGCSFYSQAVERCVQMATETSAAVRDNDTRDGFISLQKDT